MLSSTLLHQLVTGMSNLEHHFGVHVHVHGLATTRQPTSLTDCHFFTSLREIDIELMKRLSPRINVIPVIGKSDTLTPSELADFKKRVSLFEGQSCC